MLIIADDLQARGVTMGAADPIVQVEIEGASRGAAGGRGAAQGCCSNVRTLMSLLEHPWCANTWLIPLLERVLTPGRIWC